MIRGKTFFLLIGVALLLLLVSACGSTPSRLIFFERQ